MTIGNLASRSGVPATTIRYWERISVLPQPARASGQRRYATDAVYHVAVLRLAQACGFRLDEMRRLLHGFGPGVAASRRWREMARKKKRELDAQMDMLRVMRQLVDRVCQCRCAELSECGRIALSMVSTRVR